MFFFSLRGVGGRVRTHNGKFHNVFFINHPYTLDPIWYQYCTVLYCTSKSLPMCYSVTTHIFLSSYFYVFIFNWFGVPLEGKRGGGDTKRSSYILTIYPESMGYILGKPLKNFQTLDIV